MSYVMTCGARFSGGLSYLPGCSDMPRGVSTLAVVTGAVSEVDSEGGQPWS